MPELLHHQLTEKIIGTYYDVYNGLSRTYFEIHNELGPGFIHRIYANACYQEMQARGLVVVPHREITVFYRDKPVGQVKLGHLQIENKIMLFPVAIRDKEQIELENLRRWTASQGLSLGILANFYTDQLSPELMRVTSLKTPSGDK